MTYNFGVMNLSDKFPSFSFGHTYLSQLVEQPILEMVIYLVVTIVFMNLAL
jgi:hypothetical protein